MKPTTVREKNPLLTKDDVGKAKPFTHDLPGENFTYGAALRKETYGAGALTSSWQVTEVKD